MEDPLLDQEGHNNSAEEVKFTLATLTKVCEIVSILNLSCSEIVLFGALLLSIVIYLFLGYEVILVPGRVYNTLVTSNWPQFYAELRFYAIIVVSITIIRVARGLVTDMFANVLRSHLSCQFHSRYLASSHSLLRVVNRKNIDNPDQRIVADCRDFCDSLLAVVAGHPSEASAGAFEAALSVGWYSVIVINRAGVQVVLIAYAWSILASVLSAVTISFAAQARAESETSEAKLRYLHGSLRANAQSVAFEGTHDWYRTLLHVSLSHAVNAKWRVIRANIALAVVNHGFAYCVSIVMYGAIGLSIAAGNYFKDFSAGEIAEWVSQTGGVFLQLLYAFTMVVSLSARLSALVAQTHRVHDVLSALNHSSSMKEGDGNNDDGGSNAIECSALRVALPDGRFTAPITLRVAAGERVLIAGCSGVGKTSLLFALRRLAEPYSGTMNVMPYNSMFIAQEGRRLAPGSCTLRECVLGSPNDMNLTGDDIANVQQALIAVGWTRPNSMDEVRNWHSILSPGECQQIAIARIIVRNPRFAILDEPTSALDRITEEKCFHSLSFLQLGLLTVSHSKGLEVFHDKVIKMGAPSDIH